MTTPRPDVLIGLPYSEDGALAGAAYRLGANVLISTGSLYRAKAGKNRQGFQTIGRAAWKAAASLDSAGFTAMKLGGYRWTVADYVAFVVTNSGDGAMPFPWRWWSAMDYCCEPEIAANRAEVERRIALTVETYGETLDELEAWRQEGATDVPDPLPILQGRTPDDYAACAKALAAEIDARHPCTCPTGDADCGAEWHRSHAGLPELVGLGSVCRRNVHGPDGLIAVLERLDAELAPHVRLHLFGVKGQALDHLERFAHRIASVDSMAWDVRARVTAREAGMSNTVAHRADHMAAWFTRQAARLAAWSTDELEASPKASPELGAVLEPAQGRQELPALGLDPVGITTDDDNGQVLEIEGVRYVYRDGRLVPFDLDPLGRRPAHDPRGRGDPWPAPPCSRRRPTDHRRSLGVM